MLRKLMPRSIYDVMAAMACFGVLAGGTAYAANTVFSTDIVDGEVKAPDIAGNAVDSARVRDNTLNTFDVHSFIGEDVIDGTLSSADIQNFSLIEDDVASNTLGGVVIRNDSLTTSDIASQAVGSDEVVNDSLLQSDIRAGAVTGDEVLDDSLGGVDINEASLNMPPTTTATFAGQGNVDVDDTFRKVTGKTLGAGAYAVAATANLRTLPLFGNVTRDSFCELRNPSGAFIGGATDRRTVPDGQSATISLSMNGGVQIPAGGGEVGLYCRTQGDLGVTADGQIMIIRLDGFF